MSENIQIIPETFNPPTPHPAPRLPDAVDIAGAAQDALEEGEREERRLGEAQPERQHLPQREAEVDALQHGARPGGARALPREERAAAQQHAEEATRHEVRAQGGGVRAVVVVQPVKEALFRGSCTLFVLLSPSFCMAS